MVTMINVPIQNSNYQSINSTDSYTAYLVPMYWFPLIVHKMSKCSPVCSKVNFCFQYYWSNSWIVFKSAKKVYQLIWTSFAVFHWREMGYRKMIMSYTMAWHGIYWIRKENCSTSRNKKTLQTFFIVKYINVLPTA